MLPAVRLPQVVVEVDGGVSTKASVCCGLGGGKGCGYSLRRKLKIIPFGFVQNFWDLLRFCAKNLQTPRGVSFKIDLCFEKKFFVGLVVEFHSPLVVGSSAVQHKIKPNPGKICKTA